MPQLASEETAFGAAIKKVDITATCIIKPVLCTREFLKNSGIADRMNRPGRIVGKWNKIGDFTSYLCEQPGVEPLPLANGAYRLLDR